MTLKVNEVQLLLAGQGQVTINWGDGSSETVIATAGAVSYQHSYSTIDRFLIEITGPGTVTNVQVNTTPTSRLEEIRSFGELGLEVFEHSIRAANTDNVLEQNYLNTVPEKLPTSLRNLSSLFAYCDNPPVQTTFIWDWSNLESLDYFLYSAKNFEFVWKDITFTKLLTLSYFAKRSRNAKIYFDNVKNQGQTLGMDQFLQAARNVELTILRSRLTIYQPSQFVSGAGDIKITLFKTTFPNLPSTAFMFSNTRNAKIVFDDVSFPDTQVASSMFKQYGSEYVKSNEPGYGAELTLRNFHMPQADLADSMFSGWTNAKLDVDTRFTATLSNAQGMFAFMADCQVVAQGIKIRDFSTDGNFIELVSHATDSSFDFAFFDIGQHSLIRNAFNTNKRCSFNLNYAKIGSGAGFMSAFLGCSSIDVTMNDVIAQPNVDLTDAFSNVSKKSKIVANNWMLLGGARLVRAFSAITEESELTAMSWTIQGIANLTQLCRMTQPFISSYSGQKRGGSMINISGWTFNSDVTTRDLDSPSILQDGLLRDSHNTTLIANNWTFNGGAQINLGENVRSMSIAMSNWTFNNNAYLDSFAENVGVGNLSAMSITVYNWQFNPTYNITANNAFRSFGMRGSTLFGEKENAPIYLNGLGTWTPGVFDSAVNVKLNAGLDVVGLDAYSF